MQRARLPCTGAERIRPRTFAAADPLHRSAVPLPLRVRISEVIAYLPPGPAFAWGWSGRPRMRLEMMLFWTS